MEIQFPLHFVALTSVYSQLNDVSPLYPSYTLMFMKEQVFRTCFKGPLWIFSHGFLPLHCASPSGVTVKGKKLKQLTLLLMLFLKIYIFL